jgi:hypothetical protein
MRGTRSRLARLAVAVIATGAFLVAGGVPVSAGSGVGAPGQPRSISDEELFTQFIDLLRTKDTAGLAKYLSPAFVLERSDGTTVDKVGYLASPSTVNEATVHDVDGTRVRKVRVIHAVITADTVIEGQPVQSTNSPRLATYEWNGKRWQMTSYANFAPIP